MLKVRQSVRDQAWQRRLAPDDHAASAIVEATGCHPMVAQVLAGRQVTPAEAPDVLKPSLRALMPDPSTLRDMDEAARLLADAVDAGATIGLFGDYDVDGAASCALLARWLRALGREALVHIPDRITEGYGPNRPAIDALAAKGIEVLVTLDCGATSTDALTHARDLGLTVVVLDHHQMTDLGSPADALVNPNRPDDLSGLGYLCAAGVTFMALVAANRELRNRGHTEVPDLLKMLDLVALATIADVVPVRGLNRGFVVQGLKVAKAAETVGLSALVASARLKGPLQSYHFGFVLGPRINAGGRIGDAGMGARLLATEDPQEAEALARELDTLNAQRQAIEAEAVESAIASVERDGRAEGSVIIVREPDWHPGVVGLIAARLKERFQRPALAFSLSAEGVWTGSARSVPGVDVGAAVHALVADGFATKGGGHAMAAGLSVPDAQFEAMSEALAQHLAEPVEVQTATSSLQIDAVITARAASLDLVAALEEIEPFGTGFPEPVFALPSHSVRKASIVGTNHIRATLSDGDGGFLEAIAFRAAGAPLGDALFAAAGGGPIHLAGTLSRNSWQGRDSVQLRIVDVARQTDA
ncbi:MAG: single-stranded-DNA-specific exonuclease RecJ [Devosiaceae bacterium]|nr:single-stranded-DNA-specific exonuclease RecJ [Devosiaceae bacterium MH13]